MVAFYRNIAASRCWRLGLGGAGEPGPLSDQECANHANRNGASVFGHKFPSKVEKITNWVRPSFRPSSTLLPLHPAQPVLSFSTRSFLSIPQAMSAETEPQSRLAIGISFGNSYSSIAYTNSVRLPWPTAHPPHVRQRPAGFFLIRVYRKARLRSSPTKKEVRYICPPWHFLPGIWPNTTKQIARFHPLYPMSKVKSFREPKPRPNWFAIPPTPSPAFATSWAKSKCPPFLSLSCA